jgi:Uma2 family endonuclease
VVSCCSSFDDDGIVVGMTVHATLHGVTDRKDGRRRATYEDVLNAPEHKVAEIIDGVLYLSPRPAFQHALATSSLFSDLHGPYSKARGGPGGWWILFEPELHFGDDVVVPDIAGWRQSRMPNAPAGPFSSLAPDWLCETLSPSTEKLDRTKKLGVYTRARVPHVWLVDARRKTLEVLVLRGSSMVTQGTYRAHEKVRVEPFDAIEIELAFLWGEEPRASNPTGA